MRPVDWLFWGVVSVILLPVLANPAAWPVGIGLAVLLIGLRWGIREALDIRKSKVMGERGPGLTNKLVDRDELSERTGGSRHEEDDNR